MRLDISDLRSACLEVARSTILEPRPIDAAILDNHTERLFTIAREYEEFVVGQGRDPNLITRAVRYLNHTHAIPPMKDNTYWFFNMLDALIELACPNVVVNQGMEKFFCDIEEGISVARSRY